MATIAQFWLPVESFPLGAILTTHREVTVELERVIPTNDGLIPYVWIRGIEEGDMGRELDGQPEVRSLEIVDTIESDVLARVIWARDYEGVLEGLATLEITLLEAVGNRRGWRFDVRAEEHTALAEFQAFCRENDIPISITKLHRLVALEDLGVALTDAQREALLAAYDAGYYDTPRTTTLDDISNEIGISRQALAGRIRRGINSLLGQLRPTTANDVPGS